MSEVTQILHAIAEGDPDAASQLLPVVYDELRQLAAQKLARETPGQTLQPTALVHEAYLRLVGEDEEQHWDSRGHFFAAAAEAMRRILVEIARQKASLKRGGDRDRIDVVDGLLAGREPRKDLWPWTRPSPSWPRPTSRRRNWCSSATSRDCPFGRSPTSWAFPRAAQIAWWGLPRPGCTRRSRAASGPVCENPWRDSGLDFALMAPRGGCAPREPGEGAMTEREIFLAAVEKDGPAERATYLDEA